MFDKAMTTLIWYPGGKKGKYTVPNGIISIRSKAFNDCMELTEISFPQSLLHIGSWHFNCEKLVNIAVNNLHPDYYSIDGVLFNKREHWLVEYPKGRADANYIVPDRILGISPQAFYGCKQLVNIDLPESLEYIVDQAFAKCEGLKEITLPLALNYIGERAFMGCSALEKIVLSRRTRIGLHAFEGFSGEFVYLD